MKGRPRGTLAPLSADTLERLSRAFEGSPLILEHWLDGGGREPERFVFHRFERLRDYLDGVAKPGDTLCFWRYADVCREENMLAAVEYSSPLAPRGDE